MKENKKLRVYEEPEHLAWREEVYQLFEKYGISREERDKMTCAEKAKTLRYFRQLEKVDNLRKKVYN